MINFGNNGFIDLSRTGFSASSYSAEATTLFSAMTVQPDSARKKAIDDFITGCKSDGNWTLFDGVWFLAAHDRQAGKLNWKAPSSYTITEVNSPTFTTDRGFDFDGTTQYLRTGLVPSTGGLNYALNSNSFGVYVRENVTGGVNMGCASGSNETWVIARSSSNNFAMMDNSTSSASNANSTATGLSSVKREASNVTRGYRNSSILFTSAIASVGIPTVEFYISAKNGGGTANNFSPQQIAFAFVGGSIDIVKLYDRVLTYLTSLGANV